MCVGIHSLSPGMQNDDRGELDSQRRAELLREGDPGGMKQKIVKRLAIHADEPEQCMRQREDAVHIPNRQLPVEHPVEPLGSRGSSAGRAVPVSARMEPEMLVAAAFALPGVPTQDGRPALNEFREYLRLIRLDLVGMVGQVFGTITA